MDELNFQPVPKRFEFESWEDDPLRDSIMQRLLPVYEVSFAPDQPYLYVYGQSLHTVLGVKIPYDRWIGSRRFSGKYTLDRDYFPAVSLAPPFPGANHEGNHVFNIDMAEELAYSRYSRTGRKVRRYLCGCRSQFFECLPIPSDSMPMREMTIEDWKRVTNWASVCTLSSVIFNSTKFDIGKNKLFAWLKDNGYLHRSGSRKNKPSREMLDQELMVVKEGVTRITGKGMSFFLELFQEKAKTATGPVNRYGRIRLLTLNRLSTH